MKLLLKLIALVFVTLIVLSCDSNEPPIPPDETKPTLTLALDDASCIEAWMQLTTKDLTLPAEITLKQYNQAGDSVIQTFSLSTKDSLLYVDSLLPNQTYKFKVVANTTSNPQPTTNEVELTTMDTTSHNFSFQSWTFGTVGSSTLYDVAIINENNIWAVGEIMIADTSQNGYTTYNAVHWDGSEWELHKFYFYTVPGQPDTGVYEARSILAFDANNVWITCGSQITKWNGVRQINRQWTSVYANKLWGSNNNNIYAVGINGQIAHYNGTNWQRIESGTTSGVGDISGIQNDKGKSIKYCASDNLLLKIDGDNNLISIAVEQGMFLNSVWAASNRLIYTAGNGIVLYKNEKWQKIDSPDINTIYGINGQSFNDIGGLSSNLSIFHFNGFSWSSIQTGLNNIYLKIQIKNNTIATVGWQNDKAIITLLFRN